MEICASFCDKLLELIIKYQKVKFNIGFDCHGMDGYIDENTHVQNIAKYKNIHSVYLCRSSITDESVKLLSNVYSLDLSHCELITDESVKLLGNVSNLDLSYCDLITDSKGV